MTGSDYSKIYGDIGALRTFVCDMNERRGAHVTGVEAAAVEIAGTFLPDASPETVDSLRRAALLHDITKHFSRSEQLKYCREHGIILADDDLVCPKVLHSLTGAHMARAEFGAPEEVCHAICCHTTGDAGMTMLDRIIYLADYVEKNRIDPTCVYIREYMYERIRRAEEKAGIEYERLSQMGEPGRADGVQSRIRHAALQNEFDSIMLHSFDMTISYILSNGEYLHPRTLRAPPASLTEKERDA